MSLSFTKKDVLGAFYGTDGAQCVSCMSEDAWEDLDDDNVICKEAEHPDLLVQCVICGREF